MQPETVGLANQKIIEAALCAIILLDHSQIEAGLGYITRVVMMRLLNVT
jgi:hypothetical protein